MSAHIDDSPSFSLERRRSEKVGSLQFLTNFAPGQKPARSIVLATSLTPESGTALDWVVQQLCRDGDAVHLAHIVRCLHTQTEVYHSGPGNAFHVQDDAPHHERQDVVHAQAVIKERLLPTLEAAGLFYEVHVFVDTENAPPDAIGTTVLRLASELGAKAVVLAANDDQLKADADPQRLGSVANWVVSQQPQPIPVVVIRHQALDLDSQEVQEAPQPAVADAAAAAAGATED